MTRKQYNYNFDPAQDYTKQEIQEFSGLSKNTIPLSLEAAGLSTSSRVYSGEDLLAYFVPVRRLLDSGMTYDEVKAARRIPRANVSDDDGPWAGGVHADDGEGGLAELDQAIGEGIAETVYGTVEAAVNDLVEQIPNMAAIALSKAASDGSIRAAFRGRMREYFAQRKTFMPRGQVVNASSALPDISGTHQANPVSSNWIDASVIDDDAGEPMNDPEKEDFEGDSGASGCLAAEER